MHASQSSGADAIMKREEEGEEGGEGSRVPDRAEDGRKESWSGDGKEREMGRGKT